MDTGPLDRDPGQGRGLRASGRRIELLQQFHPVARYLVATANRDRRRDLSAPLASIRH